jgi:hypothetical protein
MPKSGSHELEESRMSTEKNSGSTAVKLDDALVSVTRLFLDTAPVIYFVEKNPTYLDRVQEISIGLTKAR